MRSKFKLKRGFAGIAAGGFYLSMEAILSMALLVSLLAFPLPQQDSFLQDLHVFKKENDLLLLWQQQGALGIGQMESDFRFAFPGASGKIVLDGTETAIGEGGKESIASEIAFFDSLMQRHEIKLVVFKSG